MAEVSVATEERQSASKYFCHSCCVYIEPISENYTCPLCGGGFIEELSAYLNEESPVGSSARNMALTRTLVQWALQSGHATLPLSDARSSESASDGRVPRRTAASSPAFSLQSPGNLTSFLQSLRLSAADETAATSSHDTQSRAVTTPSSFSPLINALPSLRLSQHAASTAEHYVLSAARPRPVSDSTVERAQTPRGDRHAGLTSRFASFRRVVHDLLLHCVLPRVPAGNNTPHLDAGYSSNSHHTSRAVIDDILSQLNSHLPPATASEIAALPAINITADQLARNVECTICMEDFMLSEEVRCLPCMHMFHNDCITSWLQLHATCPLCRTPLNTTTTTTITTTTTTTVITTTIITNSSDMPASLMMTSGLDTQGTTSTGQTDHVPETRSAAGLRRRRGNAADTATVAVTRPELTYYVGWASRCHGNETRSGDELEITVDDGGRSVQPGSVQTSVSDDSVASALHSGQRHVHGQRPAPAQCTVTGQHRPADVTGLDTTVNDVDQPQSVSDASDQRLKPAADCTSTPPRRTNQ